MWFLVTVMQYSSGNGYEMNELQANAMSFFICFMRIQSIVFLNLISILNLYMMKKGMLNPPMPWGDNEDLGIKIIRSLTFVPLFVFMATMYMFGMYPLARYFFLNGNTASFTDISVGSAIFTALQFSIVITFLITFLITIHYQRTHQYNFDTGIPRMY